MSRTKPTDTKTASIITDAGATFNHPDPTGAQMMPIYPEFK